MRFHFAKKSALQANFIH